MGPFHRKSYEYDRLNRLKKVTEGAWSETYLYDRYGNRAVQGAPAGMVPSSLTQYNPATNRITGIGDISYDNAGNLTGVPGLTAMTYDEENRLKTASPVGQAEEIYEYDGEGRRVKRMVGTVPTYYVRDAMGNVVREIGGIANATETRFLTVDHLGSTRLVTRWDGSVAECSDYKPFGQEMVGINSYPELPNGRSTTCGIWEKVRFTGKERDAETGLDYFGARFLPFHC